MGIILAIIVFSVIVIIHELGHFLLAKKNGIQVFEFALGMGPILVSKKFGETVYAIKLLPLGGSCMMGEDGLEEDGIPQGNFNEKSVWARFSVIVAGPVFNFLLAFIISLIVVSWGGYDPSVVGYVTEDSPADEAGIEVGDEIIELNGSSMHLWREVSLFNQFNDYDELEVTYKRDGEVNTVIIYTEYSEESGKKVMGVSSAGYVKGNVFEVVEYSAYTVKYWIDLVMKSLKMLITGNVGLNDMSGVVGIVDVMDETYEVTIVYGVSTMVLSMMNMVILLSANLGVMNLLPIPALDGGRLVFLIVEAIRKKRLSPEKEGMIHLVGFVFLMGLMVIIMFNDIVKLFG